MRCTRNRSTVLLNNHWCVRIVCDRVEMTQYYLSFTRRFLDKTGRTGSTTQLLNGVFLISAFFGVRIVYGGILVCHVSVGSCDLPGTFPNFAVL